MDSARRSFASRELTFEARSKERGAYRLVDQDDEHLPDAAGTIVEPNTD